MRRVITNKATISDLKIKAVENQNTKIKKKKKNQLIPTKTNDYIKDGRVFAEMFNNHYINIVEKTSVIASESLGDSSFSENDEETGKKIIKHYERKHFEKCLKN